MPYRNLTPHQALIKLKEGNYRFSNNMSLNQDLLQQMKDTQHKQEPFAVVLSCMDSRTSAELIFDLGIGDIFSIRIAGNVITQGVLGSLEFATAAAGSKLIVILGHTNCGAIKGACDDVKMGNLTGLLDKIKPAIAKENTITENRTSANPDFVDAVTHLNIQHSLEQVLEQSPVINDLVKNGKVGIIAALYNIGTGKIEFYENDAVIPQAQHEEKNVS
ncbi:MAG: carbonic anhydrase family protein [Chitinophagaceae bacterium]|jgi:carbonic anhydrase